MASNKILAVRSLIRPDITSSLVQLDGANKIWLIAKVPALSWMTR